MGTFLRFRLCNNVPCVLRAAAREHLRELVLGWFGIFCGVIGFDDIPRERRGSRSPVLAPLDQDTDHDLRIPAWCETDDRRFLFERRLLAYPFQAFVAADLRATRFARKFNAHEFRTLR